jgi:hypothetical protein
MHWGVDLSECARVWKGGCIIRAQLLSRLQAAYKQSPDLDNLLMDEDFSSDINHRQNAWRRIVTLRYIIVMDRMSSLLLLSLRIKGLLIILQRVSPESGDEPNYLGRLLSAQFLIDDSFLLLTSLRLVPQHRQRHRGACLIGVAGVLRHLQEGRAPRRTHAGS